VDAILGAMAAVALADGVLDAVKVDLVEGYAAALELQEDYVRVLTEAARYATLGELPDGTFGRAFFEHFRRNGFAFPGDPAGLSEGFTTPHDSSHVIAGYSTSQAGEICVSTFIGAMHPDHPMTAEVIPVLFSWHLGIKITDVAGSFRGAYEPRRFWAAWDRGAATAADLLDPSWDFWGATGVPLDELRRAYSVLPLDPALAA